jgi:succinoglycan biosynthesis transport protein ExoP
MSSQVTKRDPFASAEDEDTLDLGRMLQALWRRKWIILGLSLVIGAATALWVGAKPAVYQARATLLIEQGEANVVSIQDVYNTGYRGWEYMQTQFELLRSRSLAERVVRKLALHNMERFRPRPPAPKPWYHIDLSALKPAGFNAAPEQPWVMPSEESQILALTSMIAGGIQVQQLGDSNLVEVIYESDDAQFAASITNTYLDEYINSHLDAKLDSTLLATDWLNLRLSDLRDNLKRSEERLQAFREQEQLVDMQGVTTLSQQEISNLNNTYSQSRQRRLELEATQLELERMKDASLDELLTLPAILNHNVISGLKRNESDAQRLVSELSRRYGPKHPKMLEAVSKLTSARNALETEAQNVVFGIGREYQVALNAELSSKSQLDNTKLDLQDLNRKEFMLRELEREVETNSQLYDVFFTRIKETGEAGIFEAPPARIVDLSQGGSQVGPNVKQATMLAFALSFMALSGLAILLDILDNTIKTPADVEEKLGLAVLGTVPVMKSIKGAPAQEYWYDAKSEFAEAIRTIRTGVVLSGLDKPSRIIVVTSSVPGEGKSTLALNLGAAFAQLERTLVIGADLRRPSIARKCNLPPKHPGLSNYVAGSATMEECISSFSEFGLSVMPAGIIPSNPLELLSSIKFREALEVLKQRYDRIVIDSAPVAAVSDALMLASYADALIFVVKSDDTAATLVQKSIRQLQSSNQPLTGVVLNHFDPSKAMKYYGSYGYKYGYNQGYYNSSDTHG